MGAPWSKELRDKMVVLYNSGMETFEIAAVGNIWRLKN